MVRITQLLTTVNFVKSINKSNNYIVVHYTANNGDTAKGNASYFSSTYRGSSAHYFVDENEIYQSVLDSNTAWHCGATTYTHAYARNSNSIGVEMCSRIDSNGSYYIKDEVVQNTADLVKSLMIKYNIGIDNVIMHYNVTGKTCPAPFVNNTTLWNNFKELVQQEEAMTQSEFKAMYDTMQSDKKDNDASTYSAEAREWAIKNGIVQGTNNEEFNGQWELELTREQMVAMLYRFSQLGKQEEYLWIK